MANVVLPQAFLEEMRTLLEGEEYEAFLASYKLPRSYGLRRNPLKYEKIEFEEKMDFGLTQIPHIPEGYYYDPKKQPGKSIYHEAGAFYIQEPSAMEVVELLAPKPGDMVCDLCAAPGGKSTQIAGKLMGEGFLVSNEYVSKRAQILAGNIERMGVTNSIILNEDTERLASRFPLFFDKIVIDAPCSGEGMFRKDEVAIAEWSPENVQICAARQMEILENGARMLKPGGVLVYSTCTFSEAEDEQVIQAFLEKHPEFVADETVPSQSALEAGAVPGKIPGTVRLWPHKVRGEGHFAARLRKETDENGGFETPTFSQNKKASGKGKKADKDKVQAENQKAFEEFCKDALQEAFVQQLLENGRIIWQKEYCYWIPVFCPPLDGLKVVKPGLHLGIAKKNRFEPSHTFAMALKGKDVKTSVELPDPMAYIGGQTISVADGLGKGWCLATVDGRPIGWGKITGNIMKNHYPKGIRIV